ncbi:MAG: GMC family oxidoreductase [Shewanella sp.]
MSIVDPMVAGIAAGWSHTDGSQLTSNQRFEADVIIIGSGAGGGTAAEILAKRGLSVILVEGGALKTSQDFTMEERTAYPNLYHQAAAMKTKDKAIGIFQGRSVGGSTTVNWTTSIRTPDVTLEYWQAHKGVKLSAQSLLPWFETMEQRLHINEWPVPPNPNNAALQRGCEQLGWQFTRIKRNVLGCWNTGYCGMGCPVNAKQSMLVTTIPAALSLGASLLSRVKAVELVFKQDKISAIKALALNESLQPTGMEVELVGRHYILSGGSIHTPHLMMRSQVPDPYQLLGKRIFLHPTLLSGAIFDENIQAHSGAPQTIYSDQFVWRDGAEGELGYKLEVPPVHPILIASKTIGYGLSHAELMAQFNHLQVTIALVRDGFNRDSQGGKMQLTDSGFELDYQLTPAFWLAARHAYLSMAELQFAAGAKKVLPINDGMNYLSSWAEAKAAITKMPLQPLKTIVASAHVMGGCAFGEEKRNAMVSSDGRSHYFENLSVMDGSIFPTSLGANPQLSIYAITARNANLLADELSSVS